jgi:RNA polymerase sigma-70 factor (ECF subfamily)
VTFDCVLAAWQAHEGEVLDFLSRRLGDRTVAEDLLQDVFLKAMRQGEGFCELNSPRAWLFRVARNALTDHLRLSRPSDEIPDTLPAADAGDRDPIDELDACVARNLAYLPPADQAILEACDLDGQTVAAYAVQAGIGLAAAKSRLLRARQRLRESLIRRCQVRFDNSGNICCHVPPGRPHP